MKKALLAAAIIAISTQASAFETKDIPKHCDTVADNIAWKYYGTFPKEELFIASTMAPAYIDYATFIRYGDIPNVVVWVEDKKSWLAFVCDDDDNGKVIYIPRSKYKTYIKDVPENLYLKDTQAIEKSILD